MNILYLCEVTNSISDFTVNLTKKSTLDHAVLSVWVERP